MVGDDRTGRIGRRRRAPGGAPRRRVVTAVSLPHLFFAGVGRVTERVVRLQTGYLYHYAFAMLVGVAALMTWLTYNGLFAGVFK